MEDVSLKLSEQADIEIEESTTPASGPTSYAFAILMALQKMPMYLGTVPAHVKQRRRAKDKVAKASRKVNRK